MVFYVVCESTTHAIKARKEFERSGIRIMPGDFKGVSGCKRGYTIGVQAMNLKTLTEVIKGGNIRCKKIVYETAGGVYSEIKP